MREGQTEVRDFAKTLRRRMPRAEAILWNCLRHGPCRQHNFRRQHPIKPYIVDFASISARLIVEVDGYTHSSDEQLAHDQHRDAYLRGRRWKVIRVTNHVYEYLDNVLEGITRLLPPPRPSAGPPPQAGEDKRSCLS